jgi:hypothetical protein
MDARRRAELEADPAGCLTQEEVLAGWHWGPDWDLMLVGPDGEGCSCGHTETVADAG